MKLSIFTTITNPQYRGDHYTQSLNCYKDLADEVVVVNGGGQVTNHLGIKYINRKWPKEFEFDLIGKQFQRGYNACTGDWVLHCDVDFIFHERDFKAIRKAMENNPDAPALSLWKYQTYTPDRYILKSRLVIAVNKGKYGDRIRFDSGGDLAQPSLDGEYIKPEDIPEVRVPFYNYDFLTKTQEQVTDDISRMDRAYHRHFKKWLYSEDGTEKSAYEGWLKMVMGRYERHGGKLKIEDHPKVMQKIIKNLRPDQCGYSIFGNVPICSYFVNNGKIEL